MGDSGDFATIREVSESSRDIIMGDAVCSDASAMDVDSQEATEDADASQPTAKALEATSSSRKSGQASGTLLGAKAPPGLLAIEDIKPDEYYQAAEQIRGALDHLPEQLQQNMEPQLAEWAEWVHSIVNHQESLWLSCEYALEACERTGARINVDLSDFNHHLSHKHEIDKDVTVFNPGSLARQTIQHQAEPRMLRFIMNQTSHIMMLVEGTSLAVNQWDRKLA